MWCNRQAQNLREHVLVKRVGSSDRPQSIQSSLLFFCTMRRQSDLYEEQGGTWRSPRSGAPPPYDDTPQICSPTRQLLHLRLTCTLPHPWDYPQPSLPPNPRPEPILHTHTLYANTTDTGEGKGGRKGGGGGVLSQGWGARRRPRALIFTSPTMSLCNWWHKRPPAACLLSLRSAETIPVSSILQLSLPCYFFFPQIYSALSRKKKMF